MAVRAAAIHAAWRDPSIAGVIGVRGGYGSAQLLPLLDRDEAIRACKPFIGYSDLTAMLTFLTLGCQLVAFHGPMLVDLGDNPDGAAALLGLLSGDKGGWNMSASKIIQPGTAEAGIVGGCLSILVATLGTPYALDTAGRLLFIEDVNEKPYRIDRMLTHLRQAGKLDDVAGVIFGEMAGCVSSPDETVSVSDVIRDAFAGARFPVVYGLTTGHGMGTTTLPLGIRARLAGERLSLLESPVAE